MVVQGSPDEKGYAERLIGMIKEEEVHRSKYYNFPGAVAKIKYFSREVYRNNVETFRIMVSNPSEV